MGNAQTDETRRACEMRKRRTTLEDGRYLIYYTFVEEASEAPHARDDASSREPEARPEAEGEPSV